jgi:ribosomal protein L19
MNNNLHRIERRNAEISLSLISLVLPRGKIIELTFDSAFTHFNIQDYVKQSKKTRSHKVDYVEKKVLQYSVVGKCIRYRNRGYHTTFTIRNIVDLASYELTYSIFSPLIKSYSVRDFREGINQHPYKRATAYYLRKTTPVTSLVPFDYVIDDIYDEDA